MNYGYARFSQMEYERDNNCLELQVQELKNAGATEIFIDEFLVVRSHRPRFEELMEMLGCGDTIIITKLDRVAWSLLQGADLVASLIEKGIVVNIVNTGVMDNTYATDSVKKAFFSMADFERDIIVERTQEGKNIAKQSPDFKEGRPKVYEQRQIEEALEMLKSNSYKQVEKITGISKSTLIRAKREREKNK